MSQLTARLHTSALGGYASVLLALLVATSLLFAVAFDQGQAASLAKAAFGDSAVHELFHDARHMLGFPCH